MAAVVPAVDEAADRIDELVDGLERAAADRLPGGDREEDLDEVELRAGGVDPGE